MNCNTNTNGQHWSDLMSAETAGSIRRWVLLAKLKDLELHAAGDTKRVSDAEAWRASVLKLLADDLIREHCPGDLAIAKRRAVALGIIQPAGEVIDHV